MRTFAGSKPLPSHPSSPKQHTVVLGDGCPRQEPTTWSASRRSAGRSGFAFAFVASRYQTEDRTVPINIDCNQLTREISYIPFVQFSKCLAKLQ
ncbi:hypothetical protein CY34DRAFT_811427 [Suillus luteus UH-Slu-Lm8-n1]|uniref:Unplaced genomic scaffold CY34scaffold_414, whole genome shotgun sequence n=1 Tax=Suillus luteus UH-Slu-Lm8-n1 TaxID=930992 RepID=A0A0D0APH8_9AGAM|nr:hypothetical protein CY34DRAFT_811427 [Suillus luteus UH-Slu-Lm8-n1]